MLHIESKNFEWGLTFLNSEALRDKFENGLGGSGRKRTLPVTLAL